MDYRIYRSYKEPKREDLSWEDRWRGDDKGLIICWEIGREMRKNEPELARLAEKGELPALGWKGGVEKAIQKTEKFGTLNYLAQWQGLRGEDLNIDLLEEPEVVCAKTGIKVIFTADINKYCNE